MLLDDLLFSLKELKKAPKIRSSVKSGSKENIRGQKRGSDTDDDTLYPKGISMSKNEGD
ncbi:hypothetical protein LOAG_03004 [Loa loa]|uniref:Uncharacterized protein n=1 Tax=Loa loa TaxID=7209 RepID=A0A1S0U5M3_LOALO|nr:hypothetical protein LOAG_03004 [Loa loa]EFO25475.1 hypothetical protein LOAG_03004 [Loa loa]